MEMDRDNPASGLGITESDAFPNRNEVPLKDRLTWPVKSTKPKTVSI